MARGVVFELGIPPVISIPEKTKEIDTLSIFSSGLQTGDSFVSVAGEPVRFFQDIGYILDKHKTENLEVLFYRKATDSILTAHVKPYLEIKKKCNDTIAKFGINPNWYPASDTIHYSFLGSFSAGFKHAFGVIFMQLKSYNKMARGNVSFTKNVQGPIGIFTQLVEGFNKSGWPFFWNFTALISMVLALANILPIPALDGGHIVFLLYEGVTGKVPSEKVRIYAQRVGMVILLSLMVFIFYNDFRNLFTGSC